MTKTKRIYYPVDKKAIATSIELYKKVDLSGEYDDGHDNWDTYWASLANICPSNPWSVTYSLSSIFQQMYLANTLTVDRVYALILVSGINTTEEYIDD